MIDLLITLSQRPIVVALAIIGALLVTAGSLLAKPRPKQGSKAASPGGEEDSVLPRWLTQLGYAVTFTSIVLFIIAGFVSDLRS